MNGVSCEMECVSHGSVSVRPTAPSVTPGVPKAANTCRVAYMMSRFPKLTETFVLFEMLAVEKEVGPVEVFPLLGAFPNGDEVAGAGWWRKWRDYRRAPKSVAVMHPESKPLVAKARYLPFMSLAIAWSNLVMIASRPWKYTTTWSTILWKNRRNANFLMGSLLMFPKWAHFARCMKHLDIQHLHAHFANHPAMAAFVIHRLTGIPYSFTAHGSDLHRRKDMLKEKVRQAEFVVAISESNRKVIVEHCGPEVCRKVHVVYCGVDIEKFQPKAQPVQRGIFQIICVGTLHEVKGQSYLLEALGELRKRGVAFHLHLIGDGPDEWKLRELARSLGVESQVTFHGRQTQSQIIERLQDGDLLVTPSVPTADGRREGLPVVLMEAMACGLPVVASRLSGIPELVDDRVGRLVEPKDIQGLANAIEEFAKQPDMRRETGQRARARVVAGHSIEHNAMQLASLFRRSAKVHPEIAQGEDR